MGGDDKESLGRQFIDSPAAWSECTRHWRARRHGNARQRRHRQGCRSAVALAGLRPAGLRPGTTPACPGRRGACRVITGTGIEPSYPEFAAGRVVAVRAPTPDCRSVAGRPGSAGELGQRERLPAVGTVQRGRRAVAGVDAQRQRAPGLAPDPRCVEAVEAAAAGRDEVDAQVLAVGRRAFAGADREQIAAVVAVAAERDHEAPTVEPQELEALPGLRRVVPGAGESARLADRDHRRGEARDQEVLRLLLHGGREAAVACAVDGDMHRAFSRSAQRVPQVLALSRRHRPVGRTVGDQERRIDGVHPGDRIGLHGQRAPDRVGRERIGLVGAQHAESLVGRTEADQQRFRRRGQVVSRRPARRRGLVESHVQQVRGSVVVDHRLQAARVAQMAADRALQRGVVARGAGQGHEVPARRRSPGAEARGVERVGRRIRAQEADRRTHVVRSAPGRSRLRCRRRRPAR